MNLPARLTVAKSAWRAVLEPPPLRRLAVLDAHDTREREKERERESGREIESEKEKERYERNKEEEREGKESE